MVQIIYKSDREQSRGARHQPDPTRVQIYRAMPMPERSDRDRESRQQRRPTKQRDGMRMPSVLARSGHDADPTGQMRRGGYGCPAVGAVVLQAAAIALPWAIYQSALHGSSFWDSFLWRMVVGRKARYWLQ